MVETRFTGPDAHVVHELVTQAVRAAGERTDPARWKLIKHGSANLVVLAGSIAVRVSRTAGTAVEAERAQRLVDSLPDLPFAVPTALAEPVRADGLIAITQRRLAGLPHPSGDGDPQQLRLLLDAIHGLPLEPVRPSLAPARSFMGGDRWHEVMTEQAIPLLAPHARRAARRAAEALAALDLVPPRFTHGDLAGANVLWQHGRVSGVLDWDLASADDPAEDVAALGNWHGWGVVGAVTDSETMRRARIFAATYPLQLICVAIVNSRPEPELARAIERANVRLAS